MSATHKSAGARGGAKTAAESPSKAAALEALHASRRGKPVNPPPPRALALIKRALRPRKGAIGARPETGISIKAAASIVGVSDRTLRRWITGSHRPSSRYHSTLDQAAQAATR